MRIPEREGVIVANGDEHAIRFDGIEQVVGEIPSVRLPAARRRMKVHDERNAGDEQNRRRLEQTIMAWQDHRFPRVPRLDRAEERGEILPDVHQA